MSIQVPSNTFVDHVISAALCVMKPQQDPSVIYVKLERMGLERNRVASSLTTSVHEPISESR